MHAAAPQENLPILEIDSTAPSTAPPLLTFAHREHDDAPVVPAVCGLFFFFFFLCRPIADFGAFPSFSGMSRVVRSTVCASHGHGHGRVCVCVCLRGTQAALRSTTRVLHPLRPLHPHPSAEIDRKRWISREWLGAPLAYRPIRDSVPTWADSVPLLRETQEWAFFK